MILSTDGFVCITINEEPPGQVLTAQGKTPGITMYSTKHATVARCPTHTQYMDLTQQLYTHQVVIKAPYFFEKLKMCSRFVTLTNSTSLHG